jgi:DNA-binding LacI/PurR family transcriptional regulator
MPLEAMGRASVALLLELLEGAPARHILVDDPSPHLVLRESTSPVSERAHDRRSAST